MIENLPKQISLLKNKFSDISHQLTFAFKYIKSDPGGSLNKCRTILEKLLLQVYRCEMGSDPKKYEIGAMLNNNQFTRKLERRIVSRMNTIRDMGNLGTHGEYVENIDAKRVFEELLIVIDWYFSKYELTSECFETELKNKKFTSEILKLPEDFSAIVQNDELTEVNHVRSHYPATAFKKWELEQKTKLERLSFGLSINTDQEDFIDKNHKYEKIRRIDVLDTMGGKYTSHRWLTLRNIGADSSLFFYHKESGDNKIGFEHMSLRAYEENRNGKKLHVENLIEYQPSYIQVVRIHFPTPLKVNDLINIYYRLSWPGEPLSYSGKEHSQSISLSRCHAGVSCLEFGLLEISSILSVRCLKITDLYEEKIINDEAIFFDAEDYEDFKPIHGKGHKGFFYVFDSPDGIAYRIFYHLAKSSVEISEDEF